MPEALTVRVAGSVPKHPDSLDGIVQAADDPLKQMKTFLLARKVCTAAWLEKAGERLRTRISSTKQ